MNEINVECSTESNLYKRSVWKWLVGAKSLMKTETHLWLMVEVDVTGEEQENGK